MPAKFTDRYVKNLKPRAKRYMEFEDSGWGMGSLGIRVSPRGTKTWIHCYRADGDKKRMVSIGRYPQVTLKAARAAFVTTASKVADGEDPSRAALRERDRRRSAPRVDDLAEIYIERWAKPRKRSWAQDQAMLRRDVLPSIGHLRVEDIRRRDIIAIIDAVVDRGAPVQANRVLAVVRRMFNFAVERDLLERTPCHRVKAPGKETRRDRVLEINEVRSLLATVPELGMWTPTKLCFLFLLTTAQRPGEAIAVEWSDVDLDGRWWTIPGAKAKNGDENRVPLSDTGMRILDLAKALDHGKGAVFPSKRNGGVMVHSVLTTMLLRMRASIPVAHFTAHDLRRTAATHMSELGASRETLKGLLNHTDNEVTAIYDKFDHAPEKRAACDKWSTRLVELGMDEALDKVEATIGWQTSGRWWRKRASRLQAPE